MDDLSGSRHGSIWSDEQVGEDVAKLAVGLETDLAVVDAAAEREIIVVAEDLVVIGRLQGSAGSERVGSGAVDGSPRRGGAGVPAARGAIDRLVVGVENLEIRQRLGGNPLFSRHSVLNSGLPRCRCSARPRRRCHRRGSAELAQIEIALNGPVVGESIPAVDGEELRLVVRRLRPGEDRPVVVIEQFDRRWADHAEEIVGGARDQVDFRIGALPAKIAVEASDSRRRLVAPAIVLDALRREIEAPIPHS